MELQLSIKSKSDGSTQDVRCRVNGKAILGRGPDSTVVLNGTGMSRDHLEIEAEGGEVLVTDLSSNGSWINGRRLAKGQKCRWSGADILELPGYEIRMLVSAPAPPSAEAGATASAAAPGPVVAPPVTVKSAGAAKPAFAGRILGVIRSFTLLERALLFLTVLSLTLSILYFNS